MIETIRRDDRDEDSSENQARERRKERERVEKPAPDTIDEDQEDVAQEGDPFDTPR